MPVNINLLPDIKSEEKKRKKLLKTINIIAVVVTVILLVAMGGVITVRGMLGSKLAAISSDLEKQEKIIDEEMETESLLVGLQGHLGSISTILQSRKKYSVFLDNFTNYVPQSIRITDMTVSSSGTVIINGESPSYEKLAGFIVVLSDSGKNESTSEAGQTGGAIYKDVTLVSVSKSETEGSVRFSLSLTATEGAFNE